MKKQTIVDVLNNFPKEFDLDTLFEELIVIQKIEEGLDDLKNGKVVSHEAVKKEIKKWRK